MGIKGKIISFYLLIAIGTSIYTSIWGDLAFKGAAYNIGRSIVWPVILFPSLGAVVGGVLIVVFVLWASLGRR